MPSCQEEGKKKKKKPFKKLATNSLTEPFPPLTPHPWEGAALLSHSTQAEAAGALSQPGWAGVGEQADAHQGFWSHL